MTSPRAVDTPRRQLVTAFVVVALLASALAACSSSGGGDAERVTVYSGRLQELVGPLLDDFTEETGIEVDARYGDSSDLALLLDEEGDRSPADIFLSQSPGAMGYLDSQGDLTTLPSSILDLVPERFRAHDGHWVGVSGRVRVLAYNPDLVSEADLPTTVFDLVKPKYQDQVGVAPPNASFQDFITAMRELEGEQVAKDWLDGMAANGARPYPNNVAQLEAIGRGEIKYGLVNDYYLYEARAQNPDIAAANYYFPNSDIGSLILSTTVGVLKTSGNRSGAQQLVKFLLSKAAQEFYAEQTFEYPLADGVEPAEGKPPLDSIQSPRLDLSSLGDGLLQTRRLIADSGIEQG